MVFTPASQKFFEKSKLILKRLMLILESPNWQTLLKILSPPETLPLLEASSCMRHAPPGTLSPHWLMACPKARSVDIFLRFTFKSLVWWKMGGEGPSLTCTINLPMLLTSNLRVFCIKKKNLEIILFCMVLYRNENQLQNKCLQLDFFV